MCANACYNGAYENGIVIENYLLGDHVTQNTFLPFRVPLKGLDYRQRKYFFCWSLTLKKTGGCKNQFLPGLGKKAANFTILKLIVLKLSRPWSFYKFSIICECRKNRPFTLFDNTIMRISLNRFTTIRFGTVRFLLVKKWKELLSSLAFSMYCKAIQNFNNNIY